MLWYDFTEIIEKNVIVDWDEGILAGIVCVAKLIGRMGYISKDVIRVLQPLAQQSSKEEIQKVILVTFLEIYIGLGFQISVEIGFKGYHIITKSISIEIA